MRHIEVTQQIADSAGERLTIHMPADSGEAARLFRAWYERLQAMAPVGTAVTMTFTVPPYWDDRLPAYNAANLRLTWEPHDGEDGLVYAAMEADGAFEATVRQIGPQTWVAEVVEVGADSITCRAQWCDYALAVSWAEGKILRRTQGKAVCDDR